MSDGFGRRRPIIRQELQEIQQASGGSKWSFSLPTPMLGLLLGFGIVGLLLAAYVTKMKDFGRALDRHWSESVGYPGVEDAFRRTASTDKLLEQVHNDCKSRSDFVGRNRPRSRSDVMSVDDNILGRAVVYLSCLATAQPERLCQAVHRKHLFATVKDYYRLKGKIREEQVLSHQGPFAAQRDILVGPTRETLPTTSAMALQSDPRVIHAFKALVEGGYVTSRELESATGGWPSDLGLVLRGVKPTQKGCA